jgi:hypothetical protein
MNVTIKNTGVASIRVIIDKDTINDSVLAPDQEREITTKEQGILELRELGAVHAE